MSTPRIHLSSQGRHLLIALSPILFLLASLATIIAVKGADAVQEYSPQILLGAAAVCLLAAWLSSGISRRYLRLGIVKSASQILPAVPILLLIGTLSSTWMLSGVVPILIDYGLQMLNPTMFLLITCAVCSVVSVVTGSSWTTIATIGVAFMGIGTVLGYSAGWVAGAIISGAYFGDKVSPLSDTTVLASSSCGVDLFTHIRFLMLTSLPAMALAMCVFAVVGLVYSPGSESHASEMLASLGQTFNLNPWVLVIPAITCVLIALRVPTVWTLAVSSLTGLAGIFIFQPKILASLQSDGGNSLLTSLHILGTSTSVNTGDELLDSLVSTGGVEGMLPTVYLVLSAMIFGGTMIGTGFLARITASFTRKLRSSRHLIGATVGTGLFLNSCTGDQYLSIIVGSNVYKNTYRRNGLEPKVLSRSIEDSISVTSVLIPWNSCGVTQSTVLGVATLTYLPCCIFNIASPLMSIAMAWLGWKINPGWTNRAHAHGAAVRASLD